MTDLSPRVRSILYKLQYVTSLLTLLVGVGYAAAGNALPEWYGITVAVLAALWTYTGITADAHVAKVDR